MVEKIYGKNLKKNGHRSPFSVIRGVIKGWKLRNHHGQHTNSHRFVSLCNLSLITLFFSFFALDNHCFLLHHKSMLFYDVVQFFSTGHTL